MNASPRPAASSEAAISSIAASISGEMRVAACRSAASAAASHSRIRRSSNRSCDPGLLVEREQQPERAVERIRRRPRRRRRHRSLRVITPCDSSMRSASRIEERPTPKLCVSSRSGGSTSPGFRLRRADLPEQLLGDLLVDLAALEWLIARGRLHHSSRGFVRQADDSVGGYDRARHPKASARCLGLPEAGCAGRDVASAVTTWFDRASV